MCPLKPNIDWRHFRWGKCENAHLNAQTEEQADAISLMTPAISVSLPPKLWNTGTIKIATCQISGKFFGQE